MKIHTYRFFIPKPMSTSDVANNYGMRDEKKGSCFVVTIHENQLVAGTGLSAKFKTLHAHAPNFLPRTFVASVQYEYNNSCAKSAAGPVMQPAPSEESAKEA